MPLLARTKVASPCHESWNTMRGNDRARFCDRCSQHVYNLSEMTSEEAEALLYEHSGDLCVRFFQRADGTVMTRDCRVGQARKRRRRTIAAGLGVAAVTTSLIGAQAPGPEPVAKQVPEPSVASAVPLEQVTMGMMTSLPPAPRDREIDLEKIRQRLGKKR